MPARRLVRARLGGRRGASRSEEQAPLLDAAVAEAMDAMARVGLGGDAAPDDDSLLQLEAACSRCLAMSQKTRLERQKRRKDAAIDATAENADIARATKMMQSFLTARIAGLGNNDQDPIDDVVFHCCDAYDNRVPLKDFQLHIASVEGAMASRSQLDDAVVAKRDQELQLLLTWVETCYVTLRLLHAMEAEGGGGATPAAVADAVIAEFGRPDLAQFALSTVEMARTTGMTAEQQALEVRMQGMAPPGSAVEAMRASTRVVLLAMEHVSKR